MMRLYWKKDQTSRCGTLTLASGAVSEVTNPQNGLFTNVKGRGSYCVFVENPGFWRPSAGILQNSGNTYSNCKGQLRHPVPVCSVHSWCPFPPAPAVD